MLRQDAIVITHLELHSESRRICSTIYRVSQFYWSRKNCVPRTFFFEKSSIKLFGELYSERLHTEVELQSVTVMYQYVPSTRVR